MRRQGPFSIIMLFTKFPTSPRTSQITGPLATCVARKGITDLWPSKQPRRLNLLSWT
uniref:DAB adaptor protein 1 n=1 Tax=Molossus molossus TaxID=27622 RepID=A0A7J8F783_MOLMO|nr:DAB adaptor protein 1 [Molossus molossus]